MVQPSEMLEGLRSVNADVMSKGGGKYSGWDSWDGWSYGNDWKGLQNIFCGVRLHERRCAAVGLDVRGVRKSGVPDCSASPAFALEPFAFAFWCSLGSLVRWRSSFAFALAFVA